jgi:segregation and condensation protein B
VVRRFIKSLRPPLRLTMPALETLAVISYKQPVTGPEIGEIRGVNTSGVLKTLLDKRLITTAGRKEVIGRPILYRTSKEFLMRFGLSDLGELPSLKEFEALAREALGTEEGVAAVPDELPTDVVDEVLDAPENTGGTSESATAVEHARQDPFAEAFTHKLEGAHMSEENLSNPNDDEEVDDEVAAEVTATNEGMPAGELDEVPQDPKAVQHPESLDTRTRGKTPATPAGKSSNKSTEESRGAAAGE